MELSAEPLFSQARSSSPSFAVTVSFGSQAVDPRLLHSFLGMELTTALAHVREG